MKITYNKGGKEVRRAYFKWRTEEPWLKHSVRSFVAGYNAAKAETTKTKPKCSTDENEVSDLLFNDPYWYKA